MRLSIAALAATATCAAAFKDTSPFLMFSDSILPEQISTAQLQTRASLLHSVKAHLSTCPSQAYYILEIPSLSASQLNLHAPHLKNAITHSSVKGSVAVNEVLGLQERDGGDLRELLQEKCGAPSVWIGDKDVAAEGAIVLRGSADEHGDRRISDFDSSLYTALSKLSTSGKSYTVILLSTTASNIASPSQAQAGEQPAPVYEADFVEPLHMDLKRDLYNRAARNESGINRSQPLFEKYNFLSPGLFMGLLVTLLLLAILSVGIGAISSLEVSYGAFDKEMGPAAQSKNKQ